MVKMRCPSLFRSCLMTVKRSPAIAFKAVGKSKSEMDLLCTLNAESKGQLVVKELEELWAVAMMFFQRIDATRERIGFFFRAIHEPGSLVGIRAKRLKDGRGIAVFIAQDSVFWLVVVELLVDFVGEVDVMSFLGILLSRDAAIIEVAVFTGRKINVRHIYGSFLSGKLDKIDFFISDMVQLFDDGIHHLLKHLFSSFQLLLV